MVWVAYLYSNKERIAATMSGPRVLAVGGSATLHSFDTVTASKRLGLPVVNFGTHAGLGLSYTLDRAERILRRGDIVVLAPEYDLLLQSDRPNAYKTQLVAFFDRGYIEHVPLIDKPTYLFGYDVLPSLIEALKVMLRGPVPIPADLVQDSLGNNRGYTVARSVARQQLGLLTPKAALPITDAARRSLENFAAFAAARQIKVFVIPVSLVKTPSFPGPAYEKYLTSLPSVYASTGLMMLGTPAAGYLTLDETHDVPYHANDVGRMKYTEAMLSLICKQMACSQ